MSRHLSRFDRTILLSVVSACLLMALVDAVLRPGYLAKSLVKLCLFLGLPWLTVYRRFPLSLVRLFFRQGLRMQAFALGAGVYALILGGWLALEQLCPGLVDLSGVTAALDRDLGVNAGNFIPVSLYISFVNSLLEELFFRGFGYLLLREALSRRTAGLFSACAFALYHVAILAGWTSPHLVALAVAGLWAAGLLFNRLDEDSGTLYCSWFVHMSANFAINTIGFRLLGIL